MALHFLVNVFMCSQGRREGGHAPPPGNSHAENIGGFLANTLLQLLLALCLQLLGALPPDSHQGSAPGLRWGTSVPGPSVLSPRKQISGYAPVRSSM